MAKDNEISRMMTSGEAAQLLYVHVNTLRRWSDNGIIDAHRISSRGDRRFVREEIVELLYKLHKYGGDVKKAVGTNDNH